MLLVRPAPPIRERSGTHDGNDDCGAQELSGRLLSAPWIEDLMDHRISVEA
jgi:hypothetical protein